jgi:aspartate kinase
VVVVAGFQGVTVDGDITTLGRGGSDTTAVALAAAAGARECQIYTDVDGIFTADPNKDVNAQWIPEISYDDCLRLVRAGAQVMHDRSVVLAQQYGIDVRVRNTFKPSHPGTVICESQVSAGTQRQLEYETRSIVAHANNCGQIRELEPRQLQYAV